MTNDGYHDEFNPYSPMPANRAARREPGAVLLEIQLQNQYGNTVDVARNRGLGLPLCGETVEKSGGKIWAENVPAEGSQFHFTLPVEPDGK